MDARRLGAGPHIPLDWLVDAAPGYLTDGENNTLSDDWLARALTYVTTPCNGIPGILTPVKTGTPRNQRNRRPVAASGSTAGQPARGTPGPRYLLADYLDQYGRRHRADQIPPIDFWTAADEHAHPSDLTTLGDAAWRRGLYRDAAQLYKHATPHNARAAGVLVDHFHASHPTDRRPAQWAAAHAPLSNPFEVDSLLERLRWVGAWEQVDALIARLLAAHMLFDDPVGMARLLDSLRESAAQEQAVAALATRAAAHVALDDPGGVARLLDSLRQAGAQEQVDALVARAAAHADPGVVAWVLDSLRRAGAREQVNALLARDPAVNMRLDHPGRVAWLLDNLWKAGAQEQATTLATRAAAHAPIDDPYAADGLLRCLRKAGAQKQVDVLVARLPAAGHFDRFIEVGGNLEQFRLGRDPDGSAAPSWTWENLE
ncbi:hypothetical protein OG365_40470 (plasmid) [Streptomyces sp. NBC_00853]|uniref:hypothetical protein n=1 Tax=Streptomyces sp. NBC_00853 TaxID=2903681 RepID=UPI0038738FF2|nr:hypothetical protein OG365_40470 [Streptomyces sp. NBC_00853]